VALQKALAGMAEIPVSTRKGILILISIGTLLSILTERRMMFGGDAGGLPGAFVQEERQMEVEAVAALSQPPRLCNREELMVGEWVPKTWDYPPYQPKISKCKYEDDFLNKTWPTYEWLPTAAKGEDGCVWDMFDPAEFCNLAANKTISIVGDSLSFEHVSSLIHWMGGAIPTYKIWGKRQIEQIWLKRSFCRDSSLHVQFKSTRRLETIVDVLNTTVHHPTDVVVINRGAYFSPDDEVRTDMVERIKELEIWQEECGQQGRDCHIIWRTSVPGTTKCWTYKKPSKSLYDMEDIIGMYGNSSHWSHGMRAFHWGDFKRQNNMVLEMLSKTNLTIDVMDAYEVMMLRPDGHVNDGADCMHNCEPGKLIVYDQWLMHLMKVRREAMGSGEVLATTI